MSLSHSLPSLLLPLKSQMGQSCFYCGGARCTCRGHRASQRLIHKLQTPPSFNPPTVTNTITSSLPAHSLSVFCPSCPPLPSFSFILLYYLLFSFTPAPLCSALFYFCQVFFVQPPPHRSVSLQVIFLYSGLLLLLLHVLLSIILFFLQLFASHVLLQAAPGVISLFNLKTEFLIQCFLRNFLLYHMNQHQTYLINVFEI